MRFAIALSVHRVSLPAAKQRESTDRWSGGWGSPRICSPPADILAVGVPAGPRPDFDSGALFAWGDTAERDRDRGDAGGRDRGAPRATSRPGSLVARPVRTGRFGAALHPALEPECG
jgi:hypothetical protein